MNWFELNYFLFFREDAKKNECLSINKIFLPTGILNETARKKLFLNYFNVN